MAIYIDDYSDKKTGYFLNKNNLMTVLNSGGKSQDIIVRNNQHILKLTSTQSNQLFIADTRFTDNIDDIDMLACFSVDAVQQVPGSYGIINWDYTAEGKGLSLAFLPARGTKALQLYDDSVSRTVGFINYDWQNREKYWVRWRVEGGRNHSVKIWRDGEAEPGTWTFSVSYSNRTTGENHIGYGTYGPNHTVEYNFFSVGTNGDTPPSSVSEYITRLQPSTPTGMFSSGYGGMAFGSEFRPAFTVKEIKQQGNARLQRIHSRDTSGNARIARIEIKNQTGNSRIERTSTLTQGGNSRLQRIRSVTQSGNARIGRIQHVNQSGNAVVESFYVSNSANQSGNARIQRSNRKDQSGNAFIQHQNHVQQSGNALIQYQKQIIQGGNARIGRISTIEQRGNAQIDGGNSIRQYGNATIIHQRQITQNGASFIEYQRNITQNGRGHVVTQPNIAQNGNARIARTSNIKQIGTARVSNPTPDKLPQNWRNSDDEKPTAWRNSSDELPQNWRNNDTHEATDWQRQYYD